MADTRELLNRIASFRQKLETIVPATETVTIPEPMPIVLGEKAQRLLLLVREAIVKQKQLLNHPLLASPNEPLSAFHRVSVGMTESALKLAQQMPAGDAEQIEACDNIEQLLKTIEQRNFSLQAAMVSRQKAAQRMEKLTSYLSAMLSGRRLILNPLVDLANELLDEAKHNPKLQLIEPLEAAGQSALHFVASHGLNVAAVIARLLPHDFEWAAKPVLPVLAAMVMDVGLIGLADDQLLSNPESPTFEAHPRRGADMIRQLLAESGPLSDIVLCHHELPDGSGFPNGFAGEKIPALARFLRVADTYATLVTNRPHRDAMETRAALTEVLSLAEQGKLDRDFSEYLLHLSFHPVGTVVELADGRLAMVAAQSAAKSGNRPIVAVLTDTHGSVRMRPEILDLSRAERGGVLRSLPKRECRARLREWYPELCV